MTIHPQTGNLQSKNNPETKRLATVFGMLTLRGRSEKLQSPNLKVTTMRFWLVHDKPEDQQQGCAHGSQMDSEGGDSGETHRRRYLVLRPRPTPPEPCGRLTLTPATTRLPCGSWLRLPKMSALFGASYFPRAETLEYAINHVFLPPKTPQEGEVNIKEEHNLARFLRESVVNFCSRCSKAESEELQPVIRMLQRLMQVSPGMDGRTKKAAMASVIQELKNGESALFHIRAQNAGLLLTGQQDGVLIEAFELLAPNKDVMPHIGRLKRQFPDCAAVVDRKTMLNTEFLDELINVLHRLELRVSPLSRPKTWKSGYDFEETRDTVSPFLVTDMLLGTLGGLGRHVEPTRVSMRSREQVGWDSARLPFHRSPTWLLLRVGLRLVLDRAAPQSGQSPLYKAVTAFHHAHLLHQAKLLGFDSDLRYTMAAKLVRRVIKINPQENLPWVKVIREVIATSHDELQQRWQKTQKGHETTQDTRLKHLSFIQFGHKTPAQNAGPALGLAAIPIHGRGRLSWAWGFDEVFFYLKNPEALSLMYLNLMDLWVAMDKVAGVAVPLLLEYDPCFMPNLFRPLILPTKRQMARLHAIEAYLHNRRHRAKDTRRSFYGSMYSKFGQADSFAVRYFDSSLEHQTLLRQIENESRRTEADRIQRYHWLRTRYDDLTRERSLATHEVEWDYDQRCNIHAHDCKGCALDEKIEYLTLDIFEWPLPRDTTLAKAIVFEIRVPQVVKIWRDLTSHFFRDIFRDPGTLRGVDQLWFAADHSSLSKFYPVTSQVQLAATIKPVEASHYRGRHISTFCGDSDVSACLEAGPFDASGSILRETHADLLDDNFVRRMTAALGNALGRFRENWQNDIAVSLLACLGTRVLALTTSRRLIDALLAFLCQTRRVALQWARQLLEKQGDCNNKVERHELDQRLLMVALTCMSTFDVESDLLQDLLHSADNLNVFVETATVIHDHLPPNASLSNPILVLLAHRWRRTMHLALDSALDEIIKEKNPGFHAAIQQFWADYSPPDTQWFELSGEQSHILFARTNLENGNTMTITYNLLNGRLLVNGYPLSRLPSEYECKPACEELFGSQILEVMPSTRKGMRFSACRSQQGWVVHFTMVSGELVIQAARSTEALSVEEKSRTEIYEFIPSWKLDGDVPTSFISDYSHWVNLSTGVVEFRRADKPWVSSPDNDNWILTRTRSRNTLSRQGCYVIDPHSQTAEAILSHLNPIETRGNINTIFHPSKHMLVVDLPRYSLSFTLAEGNSSIKSKHYSGMCIDQSQSIGALVGLENRLVLKQEGVLESCTPQRTVLVPRGPISPRIVSHHVKVSVDFFAGAHVKHDAFMIDARLGRITTSGSLSSKLYLCYLHAVTSHCLPDPLTGRTGTEEALRILESASVRSFQRLDAESYQLLCGIAELSPQRQFYPSGMMVMEQVQWSNKLPVLSQHDAFWPEVEAILNHARDCEILQRDEKSTSLDLSSLKRSDLLLVSRARNRNAAFRVSDFGAEKHTAAFDCQYSGRHGENSSETFTRASAVARRVVSGSERLLARPSGSLRQVILDIAGKQFPGAPEVDITFSLDHLQSHTTSLKGIWCGLHQSVADEPNVYKVAFFLSALIFAQQGSWDLVQALLGIATAHVRFRSQVKPPKEDNFDLDYKISTMKQRVEQIVCRRLYELNRCPESELPRMSDETKTAAKRRRHEAWSTKTDQLTRSFVSNLEDQWSSRWTVSMPTGENYSAYMNVNAILQEVNKALDLARRTSLFTEYLNSLLRELGQMGVCSAGNAFVALNGPVAPPKIEQLPSLVGFVQSSALFTRPAPPTERPQPVDFSYLCDHVTLAAGEEEPLAGLFDQLARISGQKPYQVAYIDELQSSAVSTASARYRLNQGAVELERIFRDYLLGCKQAAETIRGKIDNALRGQSIAEATCQGSSLYPRISPVFLLQRLSRDFWDDLPESWRVCLVNYALSLAYVQRAERLVNASRRPERQVDLLKELRNMGSHNSEEGDPMKFPENLIIELEQGILIRPIQQGIAAKMRNPPEGDNAVMQLNMGEGKSSVIVPVVSTWLADGNRLVRVVVAKPQSKQMMHTLIGTMGGLINRRVFYLPISRALQLRSEDVAAVRRILEACRKERGVLLVQPEHLLSFKLMGLESIYAGTGQLGRDILSTYRELEDMSRDIVDESDENFSVKFELIYTIGSQQPIDMSPDRWTMIQELMDVLAEIARNLANGAEGQRVEGLLFEENEASGRYPTIRVLEESAGKCLVDAIAKQICRTGVRGFPIQHQSKQMRRAVLEYILHPTLDIEQVTAVEDVSSGLFSEPTSKNALLLLRGLLATNVILFALGQKRFRVNYGLAPDRRPSTMLAVPYRAKDSPAPRSEFSHPEVVIVLTCLSYYYQGLADNELRTCLERLSRSDQAEQEYSRWAAAAPQLPSSLAHFSGVNLKDTKLCKESVFPALRYAKPAIDFYLANVVFPKEMREFPYKLSASGWDLGKTKRHPLTGFSGTTDSKYVLPLSVTALDLPEQRHTNSAVLACLLRAENTVLELGVDAANVTALTVDLLLDAVTTSSQPMRVILDVGAQIIELSNLEVARRWLGMVPSHEADAVIFFNDHDELSVLTPCMRMRKLGQGQSVTFCVSPEMQKRIRTLVKLEDDAHALTVTDILICAIAETWEDAHRSLPLWATQGIRHQHQEVVWEEADANNGGSLSAADVARYLEAEAQSLEQRYRPISTTTPNTLNQSPPQSLLTTLHHLTTTLPPSRHPHLTLLHTKCTQFALTTHPASSTLQEEQERELAPEIERERHVERPAPRRPAPHALHEDVQRLAAHGVLNARSPAFMSAFAALAGTSAAALVPSVACGARGVAPGGGGGFPGGLLVTGDFARTVLGVAGGSGGGGRGGEGDAYQRPAQWVVTVQVQADASGGGEGMRMVLVSSWEANVLKEVLERKSREEAGGRVLLRAYLPRSSLSFDSLEDLAVHTVPAVEDPPVPPPELVMQLNLFAGQLYLRSYAEYVRLCRYLGLSYTENEGDEDIAADGFVGRAGGEGYEECGFESSPVGFLNVLFKRIRRDCLDIEKTHMGRILAGEILRERDFEDVDVKTEDVDGDTAMADTTDMKVEVEE
ncbi:hypothetical protein CHGG_10115 [Chaetomium globosum CBS 148.51]|uniref:ubiquitinyl hydrolase 1 n=1 Tax=Chaetomium globosum (strain ATCC 6205 / CBS 148.51 / DSM 1962 / NBRC 6347 / NRRL 1970) TaxID=306901 RepID=Q2GPI9_CHAGB|nr:uncharacterized protein CHGG_10115 [Chaetomium globosum CBS 148.51]EAQ83711.1 hypothetical protein CHGG_10115 [Chaetomium globosum CBS 148.51]